VAEAADRRYVPRQPRLVGARLLGPFLPLLRLLVDLLLRHVDELPSEASEAVAFGLRAGLSAFGLWILPVGSHGRQYRTEKEVADRGPRYECGGVPPRPTTKEPLGDLLVWRFRGFGLRVFCCYPPPHLSVQQILEYWLENRPIREEYLIVDGGKLAGPGAHSYSAGNLTGG
jgi:hypothetical protein